MSLMSLLFHSFFLSLAACVVVCSVKKQEARPFSQLSFDSRQSPAKQALLAAVCMKYEGATRYILASHLPLVEWSMQSYHPSLSHCNLLYYIQEVFTQRSLMHFMAEILLCLCSSIKLTDCYFASPETKKLTTFKVHKKFGNESK